MDNNELQHWGIKGQKWGLRRFQNKDGSLTPAGRKRYGEEEDDKAKKEAPKQKPKTKEEVLKSGSAKDILEFKGDLTNKEYEDAFRRLDYEKKMTSYGQAETKSALDKFSDVMGKVDQARVGTQKAIDAYNVVAKVNNAFNPSFRLPEINSGSVNKTLQKAEEAREAVRKARKDEADAIDKAKNLDKIEKDLEKKGDKVLDGLTVDELKNLNVRTQTKEQIKNRFKKDEPKETAKPKGTVEEERKPNATGPATEKKTGDTYDSKPKETTTEDKNQTKVNDTVSKISDKKVSTDSDNLPTLHISDSYSNVKLSSLKTNKSSSADKTREKTAKAVSAWYKAGHSVAEIAKKYNMSESAVYKMLEELN